MGIAVRVDYFRRRASEVVLEKLPNFGIITRNRYGADILNTDSVMFLDWDNDSTPVRLPPNQSFFANLRRAIFGYNTAKQAHIRQAKHAAIGLQKKTIESNVCQKATELGLSLRLYETFNGLRGVVTSSLFVPESEVAQELMTSLETDPLYRRLCRLQSTFRVRLTPKFWRIGISERPLHKPSQDPQELERMKLWLQQYQNKCQNFATAHFLREIGTPSPDPTIHAVIELHDIRCKVEQALELG
jgi:hypothetical protein